MDSICGNEEIVKTAEEKIGEFYTRRIESIKSIDINSVLMRKNPYLYKALGFTTPEEIVRELLMAHSISSYEGIFGDAFFEPLAEELSGGEISDADGVDIVKRIDNIYRAYAIKSGNSVFNASSKKNQNDAFQKLRGRVQKRDLAFDAVVGYGYGNKESTGGSSNFREISGQAFWKEISGYDDCYLDISKFSYEIVREKKAEFDKEFEDLIQRSIVSFNEMFCDDGIINWEKWIKYNSSIKCNKLDIKPNKRTITEGQKIELEIDVELMDDKTYTITTEDDELNIKTSSENIKIENNTISICNKISEEEKIKIQFLYRHKCKTINIKIKPKKK